jgi:hypothetical protein
MRKILFGLVLALGVLSARAQASVCTVPNTITNGNIVDATPVQQNFNALVNCSNNIDWENIDATGIFASQIIPTTPGQATFGGSVNYMFNTHVTFAESIVVDSTASPPVSGIAGGNVSQAFLLTSNAGSAAPNGVRFVVSTALPSSQPPYVFNYGGNTLFEVDAAGDGIFQGGVAFDGQQPDGTSLIGGVAATPFWLKSESGSAAGANFAFLDSNNTPPAIVVENSGASVIFTVGSQGSVRANQGLAVDDVTPPPEGIAGGSGTPAFTFDSDSSGGTNAFAFKDIGGSTNIMGFFNSTPANVLTIDETGGLTIGASGQTVVKPTSASFGGTVALPTVGANNTVCTGGSSLVIACANGAAAVQLYNGSSSPIGNGIIEWGTAVVNISGTGGPNNGTNGSTNVNLPVNMNNGYGLTVVPDTNWVMWLVTGKSSSQFTINCGNPFSTGNQTVTFNWIAVGH